MVLGRSNTVGKPTAALYMPIPYCTVTIAHS
ncbi:MAG: bifunctional 5,10-methylene-tetrahydrofolate dehydrogenase/5,10-methylene-tetrahydrofolate cyclohydrolase, partial [Candidatus Competibacteraceae bacterium]|nr:bifunctional 5,10-methylene-tetrahydrofolate dehydrogenase/5,10-methylene-tetrahydrofolate cyclohydrolase [Candidatus Competibacteraceae bacterium]